MVHDDCESSALPQGVRSGSIAQKTACRQPTVPT